jgi:hypothetical protein
VQQGLLAWGMVMRDPRGEAMRRLIRHTAATYLATDTSIQRRPSSEACDWLQLLEDRDVQFLVLDPAADRAAAELAHAHPAWQLAFEDAEAAFFARI